jgi:glycerol-3-phosphate O-acyltransferase
MIRELGLHDSHWQERLQAGEVRTLLMSFRPFRSAAVLRPFLESYRVVGDAIERHTYESSIDREALKKEALALGKQYELQGLLKTAESVSSVIMDSAIDLADNRGLFERGPDMVERRLSFAAELREMVRRLSAIDALKAGRDAGILER